MITFHAEDGVTLYHGDAGTYLATLSAAELSQVVVIMDPPYGAGKYRHDKAPSDDLFRRVLVQDPTSEARTTAKGAAIFHWPEELVGMCVRLGVVPEEWITWWPTNKCHPRAKNLMEAECVAIFGEVPGRDRIRRPRSESGQKIQAVVGDRASAGPVETARDGDVWRMAAPGCGFNHAARLHDNEKPIKLMRRLVELCSEPGDTVVDLFAGSGTTLVAARDLGRVAVGVEINKTHCRTIVDRLSQQVLAV